MELPGGQAPAAWRAFESYRHRLLATAGLLQHCAGQRTMVRVSPEWIAAALLPAAGMGRVALLPAERGAVAVAPAWL
ncbi:MAG TPA: hypothetical protein VHO91_05545 [Rhodopila sp.]|nr:hypothetical protein [Rhodopila sp.]